MGGWFCDDCWNGFDECSTDWDIEADFRRGWFRITCLRCGKVYAP